MGELVEFPRKLEWTAVESWVGEVKDLRLVARVDQRPDQNEYVWVAWQRPPGDHSAIPAAVIGSGKADTLEEAMEAAKTSLESIPIVRVPEGT